MQRVMLWGAVVVFMFSSVLNVGLFVQNQQLRRAIQTRPATVVTAPPQASSEDQSQLRQELSKSETERLRLKQEAEELKRQLQSSENAVKQSTELKNQVTQLTEQNEELRRQITNLNTMNTINGQVQELRRLLPLDSVNRQFMNRAQLRAHYNELLDREFSPEDERRYRANLKALDIALPKGDLRKAEVDSAVSSILGFYDDKTKDLVVITNRERMGVMDRVTYAHEFIHSLQDQHFNLTAMFAQTEGNSDFEAAVRALVEGDATVGMQMYAAEHLSDMDRVNYQLESIESFMMPVSSIRWGGGAQTESATAFSYNEGAMFVYALYQYGGWEEVKRAYADPPKSTEHIIYPQRYVDFDDPIAISLPNLAPALPGWEQMIDDTLGLLMMRIYLQGQLPYWQTVEVGEGWGGDRYQVWQNDQGQVSLAMLTAWDTNRDLNEFFEGYSDYLWSLGGTSLQSQVVQPGYERYTLKDKVALIKVNQANNRVLVLQAPDDATLDAMLAQFPGF